MHTQVEGVPSSFQVFQRCDVSEKLLSSILYMMESKSKMT